MENESIYFESILIRGGQIPLWPWHVERIRETFKLMKWTLRFEFYSIYKNLVLGAPKSNWVKCRLEYNQSNLKVSFEELTAAEIQTLRKPQKLVIYPEKIDVLTQNNRKKIERSIYDQSLKYAEDKGANQSILINPKGEVMECSYSNLYALKSNVLYTPPLSSGAIAGVYRRRISIRLRESFLNYRIEEKPILVEELNTFEQLYFSTAIRGLVKCSIVYL